jgi:FMN phosphatase YigB (HAD superfamily)
MSVIKNRISNIIFDLGGVVLDIDVQRTLDAFKNIGVDDKIIMEHYLTPGNFFHKFEKGLITTNEFRDSLRKLTVRNISNEEIDAAWNAMILGFPEENIKLLIYIKDKYRSILLSNTNELHFPYYSNQLAAKFPGTNLDDLFEITYYSHLVKERKPDPEIFKYVLEDSQLKPEETLFIDDMLSNLEIAQTFGIVTCQFNKPDRLDEVLGKYYLL